MIASGFLKKFWTRETPRERYDAGQKSGALPPLVSKKVYSSARKREATKMETNLFPRAQRGLSLAKLRITGNEPPGF